MTAPRQEIDARELKPGMILLRGYGRMPQTHCIRCEVVRVRKVSVPVNPLNHTDGWVAAMEVLHRRPEDHARQAMLNYPTGCRVEIEAERTRD